MLDKNIAYKNIIMRLDGRPKSVEAALPTGYSFKLFEPGDEKHWAEIEASVLEFDSPQSAEDYFTRSYLPRAHELAKRCVFVLTPAGKPVATATAWYEESELGRQATLHWVSATPTHQGRGIGRAVTVKALALMRILEPGLPIWLHTQTWSHIAVRLYHSLGFNMVRRERLANGNSKSGELEFYRNDFEEALEVLQSSVMDAAYIKELRDTAV